MALGIIAEELRPFLITMKTINGSPLILIKAEAAVPPPAGLIAKYVIKATLDGLTLDRKIPCSQASKTT
jgi:hypothetical protein